MTQPTVAANDGGWARTAGYLGIGTMALLGALTAGVIANNGDADIAIPLGIATTVFGGVMIPVVAWGGSSARTNPLVQGYPGLRFASWLVYGLTIADAVLAIGLGLSDVEVPPAVIGSIGLLGVFSAGGMALDAFESASSARVSVVSGRARNGLVLTPILGPAGHESIGMVFGLRGSM